jgi:uncharacterized LabA/DUF88 family protein
MKTAFVIDYQNVNTRGGKLFSNSTQAPGANLFVNPFAFAVNAIEERNRIKKRGQRLELEIVSVYRGLPNADADPEENALNQTQKENWERESGGKLELHHRGLSYRWSSEPHLESKTPSKRYSSREEKGIDVLCAISVLRHLQDPNIDAVILASIDSDLEPALEEGKRAAPKKILETVSWHLPGAPGGNNRIGAKLGIWNTGLPEAVYRRVLD